MKRAAPAQEQEAQFAVASSVWSGAARRQSLPLGSAQVWLDPSFGFACGSDVCPPELAIAFARFTEALFFAVRLALFVSLHLCAPATALGLTLNGIMWRGHSHPKSFSACLPRALMHENQFYEAVAAWTAGAGSAEGAATARTKSAGLAVVVDTPLASAAAVAAVSLAFRMWVMTQ